MKLLLLSVIAFISFTASHQSSFRSDYEPWPTNEWLKFHREPLPWHLARRRCEHEGSKLKTPLDKEFQTIFKELMSTHDVGAMYTGVHATFGRGDYFTIDGKPFSGQHMWRQNGLAYAREARCVIFDRDGLLASVSCDNDYPFMCSRKFALLNTTECGTTDSAYTLDKSTGSCYKLHREHEDWNTAVSVCNAEGGYLAIPSDDNEVQLLAKMVTNEEMFIGYFIWEGTNEDAKWYTVHGEPVAYNGWDGGSYNMNNCAAIQNSALIRKLYCDTKKPFICEKDVKSLSMYDRKPHE